MSKTEDTTERSRTIRSFVRRAGRRTASQDKALKELWPTYGIEYTPEPLELPATFRRSAPVCLEIGFGNGDSLVQLAKEAPATDFLGIEVHEPGVGHCMIAARQAGVDNLRLIVHDAMEVLEKQIPAASLARINLYFPDPWPKKRHHKRRIVQESFLQLCAEKLAPAGTFHIATDWENYAEHIDEVLQASALFSLAERRVSDGEQPLDRPPTKFERRGLRKGHRIWDWRFDRVDQ